MADEAKTKGKMPQKHNATSFAPGNKPGPGAPVKEMRWATLLEQELKKPLGNLHKRISTMAGYEKELQRRHAIARKYIEELIKFGDIDAMAKFIEKRIDREEGTPKQTTVLTDPKGNGLNIVTFNINNQEETNGQR